MVQKKKIGKMKKGRGNDTSCTLEQVLDVKLVTSLCAGTRLAGLTIILGSIVANKNLWIRLIGSDQTIDSISYVDTENLCTNATVTLSLCI